MSIESSDISGHH